MLFRSRTFWHPKDRQFTAEYEDASCVGPQGIAAISDGVSSAIFSRQWARILTGAVVDETPDLSDGQAFQQWLAAARQQWSTSVDFSRMNFFQRQKLQQVGGAYATLLWLEIYPDELPAGEEPLAEQASQSFRYRCFAIGDCCLFHVRDGRTVHRFPLDAAADFDADPITICSIDHRRDHLLEFHAFEETCQSGDLLVLSSDALSKWAYLRLEAGEPVDWEAMWEMSAQQWTDRVARLRDLPQGQRMRVDDTTVVMLRLAERDDLPTTLDETDDPSAWAIEVGPAVPEPALVGDDDESTTGEPSAAAKSESDVDTGAEETATDAEPVGPADAVAEPADTDTVAGDRTADGTAESQLADAVVSDFTNTSESEDCETESASSAADESSPGQDDAAHAEMNRSEVQPTAEEPDNVPPAYDEPSTQNRSQEESGDEELSNKEQADEGEPLAEPTDVDALDNADDPAAADTTYSRGNDRNT